MAAAPFGLLHVAGSTASVAAPSQGTYENVQEISRWSIGRGEARTLAFAHAYSLEFQGVTFTIDVMDSDTLRLHIENAASTTDPDWASAS